MSDAATPTPSASIWDDFVDIWTAPGTLFARRADGKFVHGLLFFVVVAAVLYFGTMGALEPIMHAEIDRSMAAGGQELTPEQMEAARNMGGIFGGIAMLVMAPITLLVVGAIIWLAAKLVGVSLSYAQGAVIACFGFFPRLIDQISGAVQAMLMDEASLTSRFVVSLGLGRLFDPDTTNAALHAFIGRIDVFTIWVTVLFAIGIKTIGKTDTGNAAVAAGLVWLLGAVPTVVSALLR